MVPDTTAYDRGRKRQPLSGIVRIHNCAHATMPQRHPPSLTEVTETSVRTGLARSGNQLTTYEVTNATRTKRADEASLKSNERKESKTIIPSMGATQGTYLGLMEGNFVGAKENKPWGVQGEMQTTA